MHFFRRHSKLFSALTTFVMVASSTFVPLAEAAEASQFYRIPIHDGKVAPSDNVKVVVAPSSIDFGDVVVGKSSSSQTVTLSNGGNTDISVGDATVSGPYSMTSDCGASLQGSALCTYRLTFSPTVMGNGSGSLTIPTSSGTKTVTLSGLGLLTANQTSMSSLSFQQAVDTTSEPKGVTLTNTGNTPLAVSGVTIAGSTFNVSHNCPASLAAGASCSAQVTFSPVAMGSATGSLVFKTTLGDQLIALSGLGLLAIPALSDASVAFGDQAVNTTSPSKAVTLRNDGNTPMAVSAVSADLPFVVSSGDCGTGTVAAGGSCTTQVSFAPSQMGSVGGNLTFATSAGTVTAALSGNGLQTSGSVNVGTLAFGDVPVGTTSPSQAVTLDNTGNTALTVSSISSTGAFSAAHDCPQQLAAGAHCTVNVSFLPASMGAVDGVLTLSTNAGAQTVAMTGTGLLAKPSVTPGSLTFANQLVSTTSNAQILTLSNAGNTATTIQAAQVTGPYTVSTTCGKSLDAYASCSYSVTFAPTVLGPSSGSLVIPTDAGNQQVSLSGNGLQAVVSTNPASIAFGNQVVGTTSAAELVTVTNSGNTSTTLSAATVSAPFAISATSCDTALSAGASCAYSVTLTPSAMGNATATLTIPTGVGAKTVSLSGFGQQTSAAASAASLSFGNQAVGSTSTAQAVTLNNTGNTPLSVSGVNASGQYSVTHNCPASLAVGASCSANVSFAPTTIGAQAGLLTFATAGGNQAVSLSGVGLLAVLSASPKTVSFGNQVVGSTSTAQTVTLSNTGNTGAAVSPTTVTGPFSVAATTCGATIAAGATCTYSLTFTPTLMNAASGMLTIPTGVGAQTVALSGTGLQTAGAVSTNTLSFAAQAVSTTSTAQTVTLNNTGNTPLAVNGVSVTGQFTFSHNCPASVAAGASCTANVVFAPTSMGAQSGTLTIATDAGSKTVALNGTGLLAVVAASPSALAFGNQSVNSTSANQTVTLTNTGNTSASVSAATVSAPYSLVSTTCGASLAGGASCAYTINFTPSTMGAASGSLSVPTGVGNKTVSLSGTGLQTSGSVPSGSLAFGNQAVSTVSTAQGVTLSNTGNTALTVNGVSVNGQYSATHNCGASVAVGSSCTVNVSFAPTSMGAQAGTLTIDTNGGVNTVALSGTGLLAVLATSPSSLAFGTQTIDTTSSAQAVTLTNSGNTSATVSAASIAAPFSVSSTTCGASLAASATCTFSIAFTPSSMGAASGSLSIPTGVGTKTVSLSGTGLQTSGSASTTTLAFGGQAVSTTSSAQSITLSNTGNTALSVSNVSTTGQFTASHNCPASLAVGASCTVSVAFAPTTMGAQSGVVTVATAAGNYSANLSGTGLLAVASVSPTSLDFGSQAVGTTSTAKVVTLSNTGNTAMTVATPTGNLTGVWSTDCPTSLAGGASCTMTVTFLPQSQGTVNQAFSMNTSVGNKTVTVTGVGTQVVLSASPSSTDFGNVQAGQTASKTITLSNTGNVAATSFSVGTLPAGFTQTNNCGTSLAGNATCIVTVTFAPTAAQAYSGSVTVAGGSASTSFSLTGTGAAQSMVSLSGSSVSVGTDMPANSNSGQYLYFQNTGVGPVTVNDHGVTNSNWSIWVSGTPNDGTCTQGSVIQPGQQCGMYVMVSASGTGAWATNAYLNTSAGQLTVSMTESTVGPTLTTVDFGAIAAGTTSQKTVTITNPARNTLRNIAVAASAPFSVASTTCGTTLASKATCTATITFTPAGAVGPWSGNYASVSGLYYQMNGTSEASGNVGWTGTYNGTLSGSGLLAKISVNPGSLSFGNQNLGSTSAVQTVTVSNTGNTSTSISAATVSTGFSASATTCGTSLAANASCTYSIVFQPTTMGASSGTLSVPTGVGTQTVSLSGTGLQTSDSITPTSLTFGSLAIGQTSSASTVTLTNTGNVALSVAAVAVSGQYQQTNNCGSTLAAGASCSASVTFAPTTMGTQTGVLTMNSSAGNHSVSLAGTGLQAVASVNTASVAFGGQAVGSSSTAQSVTLTNAGNTTMTLASPTGVAAPYSVSTTCGTSLAAGANCTYSFTFSPTSRGASSGSVTLVNSGGNNVISLSGTGLQAVASVSPTTLTFGNQAVGTSSASQSATLSNTGNTPMTVSTPTGNLSQWSWSTNCPTTLAAGASCTVTTTFQPSAQGAFSQSFSVNTSVGNTAVTVTGTGTQASLSASPTSLAFGNVQVGQSASNTFTLKNSGNIAATSLAIAAPAGYSQTSNCGTSLAASASCTVTVAFAPGAAQAYGGSVTMTATGASTSVSVSGTGTAQALTNMTGSGLNMGANLPADSGSGQYFTFKNTGYGPVTIGTNGLVSGSMYLWTGGTIGDGTCNNGTVLAAGASCNLYTYVGGAGSYSATVYLNSSAGQKTFAVSATAVAPYFTDANTGAVGAVPSATIRANTTTVRWVYLTNPANDTFRNLTLNVQAPYWIQQSTCTTTLAPGATCQFVLGFNPANNVGTWNGVYLSASGFHYQMNGGVEQVGGAPGSVAYGAWVTGTSTPFCTPGAAAWGGPVTTTFDPNVSAPNCSTFLVLYMGGGGSGASSNGGGGGAGSLGVSYTGLGGAVTVSVGGGGVSLYGGSAPGGTTCFGGLCAGGGEAGTQYGRGGNGSSGGGAGALVGGSGGNWGGGGSDGQSAGQGNYQAAITNFHMNSVWAAVGGSGAAPVPGRYYAGGGGGGIWFQGGGPSAGSDNGSGVQTGGSGWGSGGGGAAYTGACSRGCQSYTPGNGAPGLVYVEWTQ